MHPPFSILSVVISPQNDLSWLTPPTGARPRYRARPSPAAEPPAGHPSSGGVQWTGGNYRPWFPDDAHGHSAEPCRYVYCLGTVDNVALDESLLDQAKTAEARVIAAEHEAEVARAEFHRAVRHLQLAGGSLREIAEALGLSHQRVHQIVESAGGSRRWRARRPAPEQLVCCSFCGRDQKRTKALITGPGDVGICDRCIPRADATIAAEMPPAGKKVTIRFENMCPVPGDARA